MAVSPKYGSNAWILEQISKLTNGIQAVEDSLKATKKELLTRQETHLAAFASFRRSMKYLTEAFHEAFRITANATTYSQQEVTAMSADEYRDKVLIPLGMGKRSA